MADTLVVEFVVHEHARVSTRWETSELSVINELYFLRKLTFNVYVFLNPTRNYRNIITRTDVGIATTRLK